MEAHYIGFNMWVKAVEAAGTTDTDAVIEAMNGVAVPNLTGGISSMSVNHHITKPVLIGEIRDDGQFDTVWQTNGLVLGDEWSDYLPEVEGPDRQLARADVLRQLQRQDRQVRRRRPTDLRPLSARAVPVPRAPAIRDDTPCAFSLVLRLARLCSSPARSRRRRWRS